jgi:hypothetical protein
MGKGKTIGWCAWLTGMLLLVATVIHATVGLAEVMTAIKLGDVRESMAHTFRAVWIYSSVMMALSAVWAFFLAGELRQLKRRAWWQGVLLGLGYAGGAAVAMVFVGFQPPLGAFMVIGLLLLIPLLIWAGHFRRDGGNNIKSTI